jgi:hypothetical protein
VGSRRLIAWAMARPQTWILLHCKYLFAFSITDVQWEHKYYNIRCIKVYNEHLLQSFKNMYWKRHIYICRNTYTLRILVGRPL